MHELSEIPLPLPVQVRVHQGLGRRWFKGRFTSFLRRFGGQRMQDMLVSQPWSEFPLHALNAATQPQPTRRSELLSKQLH